MAIAGFPPPPLTGERTVPGIDRENYWFRRHEAVYLRLADHFAREPTGTRVVDAGCGEGYGAELLARAGTECLAVDLDPATIDHVRRAHLQPDHALTEVRPLVANLDALPLADGSVDAVVSLQVIEHLWDLPRFLGECVRVLRPGGLLVVSTPNRLTFSPGLDRGQKPLNPFHCEEFDSDQLADMLINAGLTGTRVVGLHHGPRISRWEQGFGSLPAAQVAAITAGQWPTELAEFVASVTAGDFVFGEGTDTSLDLIATATRQLGVDQPTPGEPDPNTELVR